jgi:hypothetical protein
MNFGHEMQGGKVGPSPKGKDLAAREAELAKREQELRRKEAALATAGGVDHRLIANFPPCLPMVHHDINNDVPDYNKGIMRAYVPLQYPGTRCLCVTLAS